MKGQNNMIICDHCRRVGVPAAQVHISVGTLRKPSEVRTDPKTGGGNWINSEFTVSVRDEPRVDACDECIKELAAVVRGLFLGFSHGEDTDHQPTLDEIDKELSSSLSPERLT